MPRWVGDVIVWGSDWLSRGEFHPNVYWEVLNYKSNLSLRRRAAGRAKE